MSTREGAKDTDSERRGSRLRTLTEKGEAAFNTNLQKYNAKLNAIVKDIEEEFVNFAVSEKTKETVTVIRDRLLELSDTYEANNNYTIEYLMRTNSIESNAELKTRQITFEHILQGVLCLKRHAWYHPEGIQKHGKQPSQQSFWYVNYKLHASQETG